MTINKQYFYIPDNRPLAIISKFIPVDSWITEPGYLIDINTLDGILELEFASQEGIGLLLDALLELLNSTDKKDRDISVETFMPENQF